MRLRTVSGPGNTGLMLTVREHTALRLAGAHFKFAGARAEAIRSELGLSEAQHSRLVLSIIDREDALAESPQLVHRLRRIRDQRRAARSA